MTATSRSWRLRPRRQTNLSSDNLFLSFLDAIQETIPDAMRDIMTCEPTYIMMGMSAETFWGGLEGNAEFTARIREKIGPDMGLTTGANALDAHRQWSHRSRTAAHVSLRRPGVHGLCR